MFPRLIDLHQKHLEEGPSLSAANCRRSSRSGGCLGEILIALISAPIITSYGIHLERRNGLVDIAAELPPVDLIVRPQITPTLGGILLRPSLGIMVVAFIFLGCSVSSYIFRRQDKDHYQTVVFAAMIIWAMMLAHGTHAGTNLTTTAIVPWTLFASMLLSRGGHAAARWLRNKPPASRDIACEKGQP